MTTGCSYSESSKFNSTSKLVVGNFNSIKVTVNRILVLETNDKSIIEKIINEVNTSKKDWATEMEFVEEPNGMITLIGETEIEIPFFEQSGRALFDKFYIYTEFNFE